MPLAFSDDTLMYMTRTLNKYSSHITQPKAQGASQAMLYATGMSEADMAKPQVGIASVWFEGTPAICICFTWPRR